MRSTESTMGNINICLRNLSPSQPAKSFLASTSQNLKPLSKFQSAYRMVLTPLPMRRFGSLTPRGHERSFGLSQHVLFRLISSPLGWALLISWMVVKSAPKERPSGLSCPKESQLAAHLLSRKPQGYCVSLRIISMPNTRIKNLICSPFQIFNRGMENAGLVTFREALLLVAPAQTSPGRLRGVRSIISHELAHMWFGNSVSPTFWHELWLNEGFATWLVTSLPLKANGHRQKDVVSPSPNSVSCVSMPRTACGLFASRFKHRAILRTPLMASRIGKVLPCSG